jgi:hypothetical protein
VRREVVQHDTDLSHFCKVLDETSTAKAIGYAPNHLRQRAVQHQPVHHARRSRRRGIRASRASGEPAASRSTRNSPPMYASAWRAPGRCREPSISTAARAPNTRPRSRSRACTDGRTPHAHRRPGSPRIPRVTRQKGPVPCYRILAMNNSSWAAPNSRLGRRGGSQVSISATLFVTILHVNNIVNV